MSEFIQAKLGPIPRPSPAAATMNLGDIIGKQGIDEITAAGAILFHAVGDTGRPGGAYQDQETAADIMTSDYDVAVPARNPAFLLHLGDVIYGHDKHQE
jgi:hypothetical protein